MTLVKRIDMALHVQELCAKNGITVSYVPLDDKRPFYCANRVRNSITIRPTKNTGYYVSALHEIGHLIGPNQNSNYDRFEMEVGAWKYAMATAIDGLSAFSAATGSSGLTITITPTEAGSTVNIINKWKIK